MLEEKTICPPNAQLESFVLGNLPLDAIEEIASHLTNCPTCQSTLESFRSVSDAFVARLQQPVRPGPFVEEPECHEVVRQIQQLDAGPSVTSVKESSPNSSAVNGCERKQVGDYALLEEIHVGPMGTVYRAVHTKLGREVALKVLPPERMRDEQMVARFRREMKAVGKPDHPNIVRDRDAGEIDGVHYLVMELVAGIDLSALVENHAPPLPVADVCELIRQAAIGLQHAHELGLVHRDIKPSNMMLSHGGSLKILDFGLARLRDQVAEHDLTEMDQMMGTLDYMAPEQASDSHAVDIRADIYSLGCTFYKLLTGQAPFENGKYEKPVKKMMAHSETPVPPICDRRPDVPHELAALVKKMLAKRPDQRFATPAEVAEAVGPFTAGCNLAALLDAAQIESDERESNVDPPPVASDDIVVQTAAPRKKKIPAMWVWLASVAALLVLSAGVFYAPKLWSTSQRQDDDRAAGDGVHLAESPNPSDVSEGAKDDSRTAHPSKSATSESPLSNAESRVAHNGPSGRAEAEPPNVDQPGGDKRDNGANAGNIISTAVADGRFRTILKWAMATGLLEELNVPGPLTIFAPTDRAIQESLPAQNVVFLEKNPGQLSELLLYHAVRGRLTVNDLGQNKDTRTVRGYPLNITEDREGLWVVNAKLIQPDINCSNGVIHVIDHILVPPDLNLPKPPVVEGALGMMMAEIPGGHFLMGSPPDEQGRLPHEGPQLRMNIATFYMSQYEVTRSQFVAAMGHDPSGDRRVRILRRREKPEDDPVQQVSWFAAVEFCNKLSQLDGLENYYMIRGQEVTVSDPKGNGYRLPTEPEWEYACRAGSRGMYCFGDQDSQLANFAWFAINSKKVVNRNLQFMWNEVGQKACNALGLFDMHGNVQEWCEDWYGSYGGNQASEERVVRGGSYMRRAADLRSAARSSAPPGYRHSSIGFRVARSAERKGKS